MCSIIGAAGPIAGLSPKLRQEFHEFLSCLFTMAECRGRDAAGFWVWRGDHYVYEKRPTAAQDLIQRSVRWKSLRFNPGTLYLCHTRAATDGDPNHNVNNHPHIGKHSVMVHNGCVWSWQSIMNAEKLELKSECDSEILLRLAEAKEDIVEGLQHLYQTTHESNGTASIACAFVDRREPNKILLSRNTGSPCYIYRSERFNCTFFCSTEQIFEKALDLMYDTDKPEVIGAKSESIKTHQLYSLKEDGTFEDEHLVTVYYTGTGSSNYGGSRFTDDSTTDSQLLATPITEGRQYELDILGELVELIASDDDEYDEEDFMDADEMPEEIQYELVHCLEKVVAQK
jgi:glucosamine 6-phosphate synthetase-like amidotransferase/phosphosugar isomerase protein